MPLPKYPQQSPPRFMRRLKDFSLPLSLLVGIVCWRWLAPLKPLLPYLIGGMLFFTSLKLAPQAIRITRAHLLLGLLQLVLAVLSYIFLLRWSGLSDPLLRIEAAEGALICFLAPAATASAVIISILGGSIASGATYCILTNVAMAFIAPIIFTYIGFDQTQLSFFDSVWRIFVGVAPLIFTPLFIAWTIRYSSPSFHARLSSLSQVAYWLWVISLAIVLAYTIQFVVEQHCSALKLIILSCCGLVACIVQFLLGRWVGHKLEGDSTTSGQSLGQKNTTLAIWMAQTYLHPLSSIAPASYIIWQNSINSFQIWRKAKSERAKAHR